MLAGLSGCGDVESSEGKGICVVCEGRGRGLIGADRERGRRERLEKVLGVVVVFEHDNCVVIIA